MSLALGIVLTGCSPAPAPDADAGEQAVDTAAETTALRALQPARLGPWTRTRTAPRLAPKDLHRLARELGIPRS